MDNPEVAAATESPRGSAARGCALMLVAMGVVVTASALALRAAPGTALQVSSQNSPPTGSGPASMPASTSVASWLPATPYAVPALPTLPAPGYADVAPTDQYFVDQTGGTGWANRCWNHLRTGQYPWARAACVRGLGLNPSAPYPRVWLLYDMGLIEAHDGRPEIARAYFAHSLALRPQGDPGVGEVQKALAALGPPTQKP
jgi:hypothetical protein